jgi:hypothetical protein
VRIVSLVALWLVASLLIGGRAWGFTPRPRDVAEMPDTPSSSQQYNGELDGEDGFVIAPIPPPPVTELSCPLAARPTGDVPSGRLFVSEIFRPPIPSRA